MTRLRWFELCRELLEDAEAQAGYEAADRAIRLGRQVREIREARGMSQAELAGRMGVGRSSIARLEAGEVDPKLGTIAQLGRALDAELVVELRPVGIA